MDLPSHLAALAQTLPFETEAERCGRGFRGRGLRKQYGRWSDGLWVGLVRQIRRCQQEPMFSLTMENQF